MSTVKIAASNVAADATIVSLDLKLLTIHIGAVTQDIATMKNDLANLSTGGLPATPGAAAAIAAVGKAIGQAAAKANGEIDQVNADVTRAYAVANGMAAGSCPRNAAKRSPHQAADFGQPDSRPRGLAPSGCGSACQDGGPDRMLMTGR